jgi:hypothetical protein
MGNIVTLVVPLPLVRKAKKLKINISRFTREALADEVSRLEKEKEIVRASASKPIPDNDAPSSSLESKVINSVSVL